jgi:ribonuclease HI
MAEKTSPFLPISQKVADDTRRYLLPWDNAGPNDLFEHVVVGESPYQSRLVRKNDPREILIYFAGCSFYEGTPNVSAGYGIYLSREITLSARLEGQGPETQERAELRAAIVTVGLREWWRDGVNRVLLACDSDYVVWGIWNARSKHGSLVPIDCDNTAAGTPRGQDRVLVESPLSQPSQQKS